VDGQPLGRFHAPLGPRSRAPRGHVRGDDEVKLGGNGRRPGRCRGDEEVNTQVTVHASRPRSEDSEVNTRVNGGRILRAMRRPAARLRRQDSDLACTAPGRREWPTARRTSGGRRCRQDPIGGPREERRRERRRDHRSGRSSCPASDEEDRHVPHPDEPGRRVARAARASRTRRALKQWSIAHPALRGVADLDALLERRRDDQAAPAILRALAVLATATIWVRGPCCRRCWEHWSAWPGSSATTTRPRSRRWCR